MGPSLNEILTKGKEANWVKPVSSPCCGKACWWHDWRDRWCNWGKIPVRRWRCSGCRKAKTLCPQGLFPRFQASIFQIIRTCLRRFQGKFWIEVHDHFHRQRMRWWVRVAEKIKKVWKNLTEGLRHLAKKFPARAPFSRSWLPHPRVS